MYDFERFCTFLYVFVLLFYVILYNVKRYIPQPLQPCRGFLLQKIIYSKGKRQLLKSCKYCGRIHDTKYVCANKPSYYPKSSTEATRVHNSSKWNKTREIVRRRDAYACAYCLKDKRINCTDIEVHHIVPINEDNSKEYDLDNLITLCRRHHELAEKGLIDRKELLDIVSARNENLWGTQYTPGV